MSFKEKLKKLFKASSGILSTEEVEAAGIPRQYLWILKNENEIQMISRGIYASNEVFEDEMYLISLRTNKAIFSHETALYIHNLTDRDPLFYTITLPSGYNPSRLKSSNIEVHTVKEEFFEIGKTTAKTIYGRDITVYDKERTICDIVKNERKSGLDIEQRNKIIRKAFSNNDIDGSILIQYAKKLKCEKKIRVIMEVLTW